MKIHLIAIGGAVMHNLALTLKVLGYQVTGSDDEIYNPSKKRLADAGLLPDKMGWDKNRIHNDLDLVILGMHAKMDNPELLKAQSLGIPIHSFPTFIYEHSRDKSRVVVAGSHGKTTTTSMIMHVLKENHRDFDYLVGAKLDGFERMVSLSDADLMVIEGDEYLSSAMDARPKMLHYRADLAVITGIAWDHINVFPSFELYRQAFHDFLLSLNENARVWYDANDAELVKLIRQCNRNDLRFHAYSPFEQSDNNDIIHQGSEYTFQLFGKHNLSNAKAAFEVCKEIGLKEKDILESLSNFKGADRRLQPFHTKSGKILYHDFAHAPSKVNATVKAVRSRHSDAKISAILELHTYSSLNSDFLPYYQHSLDGLDKSLIFIHQKTLEIKNRPMPDPQYIRNAFDKQELIIASTTEELEFYLKDFLQSTDVILVMSSGQLGGLDIKTVASKK